jgi:L-ascorbate metabolism protein UlaG (beta-lactamase superfamily)
LHVDDVTITLAGNATVLIRCGERAVLADPWLTDRIGPWRRWRPCGLREADLPSLTVLLISHAHVDHLNPGSLRTIPRSTLVLSPGGTPLRKLRALGFTAAAPLCEWEQWEEEGVVVTAVPSIHTRWSLGFVVELAGRRIYFAGDAGPRTPFAEIARRCGPLGAAILPVGGSSLALGPLQRHLTPEAAVRAAMALRPRLVLPMHWGHVPCVPAFLDRFRGTAAQFTALLAERAPEIQAVCPEDGTATVLEVSQAVSINSSPAGAR